MVQRFLLGLAVVLALGGCSGGGGGSSAASSFSGASSGSGGGTGGAGGSAGAPSSSAVSQAQWQVALAALGATSTPTALPLGFDPAAFVTWNALFARSWPVIRQQILDPRLEAELRSQLAGLSSGLIKVQNVRNVVIDTAAPLALEGSGSGSAITFGLHLPGAPGAWHFAFTVDVGATFSTRIAGVPISAVLTLDVEADILQARVDEVVVLDASNPSRPVISSVGSPQVALTLSLRSANPLLSQIVTPLSRILDPVVRAALASGALFGQKQVVQTLSQLPTVPYGLGGPPVAAVPTAPTLSALADLISSEIQLYHMPFDTVVPAHFDQPGYGNGQLVGHHDFGDSTIWTGHYVMAEALRYDLTGDPRALAGADRGLHGLETCLDVAGQGGGLLSRCVVPLSSPDINAIAGGGDYFVGSVNGVPTGSIGDISRDQYLGVFMACIECYLRVPTLRTRAHDMLVRMVDYLDGHDWNAYKVNSTEISRASPMAQTPGFIFQALACANAVDPARYGARFAAVANIPSVLWFIEWTSSREVMDSYFKFNLGHAELTICVATETDPARYREFVKKTEILRDAIGHHQNAWFDAVYGMTVPAAAAGMGPQVEAELQHWALRPRREFSIQNSTDPSVAQARYTNPLFSQAFAVIAATPLPIEKRCPTDFLWQRGPFDLDGGGDPRNQPAGVDLVLPYWTARSFGMIK